MEHSTYCNHFTLYVSQTIMLYPLHIYDDVCPLFPPQKKTWKEILKKKKEMGGIWVAQLVKYLPLARVMIPESWN